MKTKEEIVAEIEHGKDYLNKYKNHKINLVANKKDFKNLSSDVIYNLMIQNLEWVLDGD